MRLLIHFIFFIFIFFFASRTIAMCLYCSIVLFYELLCRYHVQVVAYTSHITLIVLNTFYLKFLRRSQFVMFLKYLGCCSYEICLFAITEFRNHEIEGLGCILESFALFQATCDHFQMIYVLFEISKFDYRIK